MACHERMVPVVIRFADIGPDCIAETCYHRTSERYTVMAILPPNRVTAKPLTMTVSTPLSSIVTDDRAGSLSELVGTAIHIYRIEKFRSEQYNRDGFRIVLRTQSDGVETSGDMLFTGFAMPVMRTVLALLEHPDTILRECDPPISCTVTQMGNTYGLA